MMGGNAMNVGGGSLQNLAQQAAGQGGQWTPGQWTGPPGGYPGGWKPEDPTNPFHIPNETYDPNNPMPPDPNPMPGTTPEGYVYPGQRPEQQWNFQQGASNWMAQHPDLNYQRGMQDIENRQMDAQPGWLQGIFNNYFTSHIGRPWPGQNPQTTQDPMSQQGGYNDIAPWLQNWKQQQQQAPTFDDRFPSDMSS
jgi:hypothetical protein